MSAINPFLVFTDRLNRLGARHMVTGAVASIAYGEPRLTHDVDIVIEISREQCARFRELFPEAEFYCPPVEVLLIEASRPQRGHFNLIHHDTGLKADIYPCGQDRLSAWGLDHARKLIVDASEVWIAPIEYVIARKLEHYSDQCRQLFFLDEMQLVYEERQCRAGLLGGGAESVSRRRATGSGGTWTSVR